MYNNGTEKTLLLGKLLFKGIIYNKRNIIKLNVGILLTEFP